MPLPADQVQELKLIAPNIGVCDEGGVSFVFIPNYSLPNGCSPASTDLLLCPVARDGYDSRLYFRDRVEPQQRPGRPTLNWNVNSIRIGERNWQAFSWRTKPGLRLAQMLSIHLKALQ